MHPQPTREYGLSDRPILAPAQVTIIVPVGGGAPAWSRCAASLARLDPGPAEIVAVIDGSNDDLAAVAAEIGARVVMLEQRGGPARARNRGAEQASGDVLLFVDADIEVSADLVVRVADLFSTRSKMVAAFGSYDDAPADKGFLSQYRNLLHHWVHQTSREVASTFWAGCGAVRRQAFRDVGGFDERFRDRIEDIELGARLLRIGPIHLEKDLQVKHLKRWHLVDMVVTDLCRRAVPWTELILGDGHLVNDLNIKVRDRISVLLAAVALTCLAAAWAWPPLLGPGVGALLMMVAVNGALFRFFIRRRGLPFALGAVAAHWLYLLTCGLGFVLGFGRHLLSRR
jgi:glycosyltransferase involved in cell wall biosynthesis